MNVVDMPDKNDVRASVELLRRHHADMIEMIKLGASLKFCAFTAYVAEGFTPEQAIELCKVSVLTP